MPHGKKIWIDGSVIKNFWGILCSSWCHYYFIDDKVCFLYMYKCILDKVSVMFINIT